MFQRPLIPILLSFVGGISIGTVWLFDGHDIGILLSVVIASCLISSLLIPPTTRFPCFILIFFLVGIHIASTKKPDSVLSSLAEQREKVVLEGTVLETTWISPEKARFVFRAEKLFVQGKVRLLSEKIQVAIYNYAENIPPGSKIRFPARLRSFTNFNNPGRYDYESAMRFRGLSCVASVSDGRQIVPMGMRHLGFPLQGLEKARTPIRVFFEERLSSRNRALFQAIVLGERQSIGHELREPFNVTGLGHILVVSGLHVGLVAWLVFFLFKKALSLSYRLTLRIDVKKAAAIVTLFPVVVYTFLAGLHVSSQRAMIMILAYLVSIILGREKEVWSTLASAAFLVLALEPHALFSASFQLSFLAVIGILWLAPAIYQIIPTVQGGRMWQTRILSGVYVYFTGLFVVTVAAVVFLLPLTTFYFHRISLVAVPANLTTVPILGLWVLPLGLLSSFVLPVLPSVAELLIEAGAWGLDCMMAIIQFWSGIPGASFWVVTPNTIEIILFYGLITFIFFFHKGTWARVGLLLVLLFSTVDVSYWIYKTRFSRHLKITYLDVGQGNAALIQFPGKEKMLIDGGGFLDDSFDVGRMVIAPFLWQLKIRKLDYLVLTHPQADHMNGLRFIASHFGPKEFWHNGDRAQSISFDKLMKLLDSKKIDKIHAPILIKEKNISGVKIELLHPLPDRNRRKAHRPAVGVNDNSLVLKVSYKGKSFLFPGDLERPGEEAVIANSGPHLKSEILLAPHHGSRSSLSRPFLKMVKPEICIISSGKGNAFGFPHRSTLKKLKDTGCKTIRIDRVGAVQVVVGSNLFEITSFLGGK